MTTGQEDGVWKSNMSPIIELDSNIFHQLKKFMRQIIKIKEEEGKGEMRTSFNHNKCEIWKYPKIAKHFTQQKKNLIDNYQSFYQRNDRKKKQQNKQNKS